VFNINSCPSDIYSEKPSNKKINSVSIFNINKIIKYFGIYTPASFACKFFDIKVSNTKIIDIIRKIRKTILFSILCATLLPAGPTKGSSMHKIKKETLEKIVNNEPVEGLLIHFVKLKSTNYILNN
tara:strand:- start:835 stop:1212 length:378 start_codon:yes stop_codon:yes gene_type:complete